MTDFTFFHPDVTYSFGAVPKFPQPTLPPSNSAVALNEFLCATSQAISQTESQVFDHVAALTQFIHTQIAADSALSRRLIQHNLGDA